MKQCTLTSCEMPILAKSLCSKHYYRQKRGQSLFDKSRFDRRPVIVDGDAAKIELGGNKGYTLIDVEFSYLDMYSWHVDGRGYVAAAIDGKQVKLHHLVAGKPLKPLVVDHKNRDKLDNRKANLRITTSSINNYNRADSPGISGHKGVSFDKRRNRWLAQIGSRQTHKFLGYFDTVEEAVVARKAAEEALNLK